MRQWHGNTKGDEFATVEPSSNVSDGVHDINEDAEELEAIILSVKKTCTPNSPKCLDTHRWK